MKEKRIINIDENISFGKYRGVKIKDIALNDPDYIEWLCKEVKDLIISEKIIDELSEYCLSVFFNDPELYLAQTGTNTTLVSYQYLKYGNKEMILGLNRNTSIIEKIKGLPISGSNQQFARKVFNGENCKLIIKERMKTESRNIDQFQDENSNEPDNEELRRLYNDAYEIDSNEFDGWYEPID